MNIFKKYFDLEERKVKALEGINKKLGKISLYEVLVTKDVNLSVPDLPGQVGKEDDDK